MRMTRAILVSLLLVAGAACSNDKKVGDEKLLEFDEKTGQRVGGITTTLPPATTTNKPGPATTATTARPGTTARPAATAPATTKPAGAGFTVRIVSTGQGFEPFAFVVKRGTRVRVVNADTEARTFTSDEKGLFDSGSIPPNGTYDVVASTAGKHNFHDETRPFAVGEMTVQA